MYTFVYRTFIKFILFLPGTGTRFAEDLENEVSMPSWAWVVTSRRPEVFGRDGSFNALSGLSCYLCHAAYFCKGWEFQCPLGLIPHFYESEKNRRDFVQGCVNALSGLYLISTSTSSGAKRGYVFVSMPSRAYTSFLRYPFKNLGFMRFPEPVFAGIYQNILATAVFRAC